MIPEQRKSPRRVIRRQQAKILLPDCAPAACFVSDISDTGAQLGLKAMAEVPDHFTLSFLDHPKIERLCHVVWRGAKSVGVKFEKRPSATSHC